MININKSILHILGMNESELCLSDRELSLSEGIHDFLSNHIEKSLSLAESKCGKFYEDSEFKKLFLSYVSGEKDFLSFSREAATMLSGILIHSKEAKRAALIVIDADVEGERKLIIFKTSGNAGFLYETLAGENGAYNEISCKNGIMPPVGRRMSEFAFIDAESLDLKVLNKRVEIDGSMVFAFSEMFLECALLPSEREAIKVIKDTAKAVGESFGMDETKTMAKVKTAIQKELEEGEALNFMQAGKEIFDEYPQMQREYEQKLESKGFTGEVPVNREATLKKMRNHKLQTDTGIELVIPVDYLDNTDFVEFNKDEDGSLTITLKQIGSITNR